MYHFCLQYYRKRKWWLLCIMAAPQKRDLMRTDVPEPPLMKNMRRTCLAVCGGPNNWLKGSGEGLHSPPTAPRREPALPRYNTLHSVWEAPLNNTR